MPTARPRDTQEVPWPTSFELLRFVARALAVDDPKAIPALKGKQLQRFFRGRVDEINPGTTWDILKGLVDRYLVQDPVVVHVIPFADRREAFMDEVAWIVVQHMAAWDAFVSRQAELYQRSPATMRKRAAYRQLDFLAFELGVFLGYFMVQNGTKLPPDIGLWKWRTPINQDRTLRQFLRSHHIGRDQLARLLGMRNRTAVDRWFDWGRRPSDENIRAIARVIEENPAKQEDLRQALRRHFALRQFANDVAAILGWDEIDRLLGALLRFATRTHDYLTATNIRAEYRPIICKFVLDGWLKHAPSPQLVRYLLVSEEDRRWRGVLRGLQFGSFHARPGEIARPDGLPERVIRYPRTALMTPFDSIDPGPYGDDQAVDTNTSVQS